MKAAVTLKQGLSFTGRADSDFTVDLGADPAVGGDDDGLRPMEMLLIALAGCTAMDVLSILRKKRQHVTHFEVTVDAEQSSEHPKVFTDILVRYVVHGVNVAPKAVERSIELSSTKYCPVQFMLEPAVPVRHEYEIIEEGSSSGAGT